MYCVFKSESYSKDTSLNICIYSKNILEIGSFKLSEIVNTSGAKHLGKGLLPGVFLLGLGEYEANCSDLGHY